VKGEWLGTLITDHGFPFFQNEEFVFTFKAGAETVTFKTAEIPADWTFWIPLLHNSLVTVRPVFHHSISPKTFHCIRLDLHTEGLTDYSLKYFKHETMLSQVLSRVCVYQEGPATLLSKHSIFPTKKRVLDEVYDGLPLAYGSHVDFLIGCVSERIPKAVSLQPRHIISGHALANKVQLVYNLVGAQNALILTDRPDYFPGNHLVNRFRITKEDLQSNHIFVLEKRYLKDVLREQDRDLKSFAEILGLATNTTPSLSQVRRYLWNGFWHKHQSASISLANVAWPVLIEDGPCDTESFTATKRIHLLEHECLRGRWPLLAEVSEIYQERHSEFLKTTFPIWSQFVTNLDIPKSLLRKIKTRVLHVRPTLSESRFGLFEHMPFQKDHALLRLAPISVDKAQLKVLLQDAYATKSISFASLLGKPFRGSQTFALETVEKEGPCSICQDVPMDQRIVTLCGHIFCHDCSLQVFADSIRSPLKPTECPYCREWLTCGDIFTIGHTAKTLCFCSKKLAIVPKTTVIDEEGLLGSIHEFVASEKYTIVSLRDVDSFVQKLLRHAVTVPSIKVVLLSNPKDTYVDDFVSYF
jgi:hypothetical protein